MTFRRRLRAARRSPIRGLAARMLALSFLLVAGPASQAGALETETFGVEPYPLFEEGVAQRGFEMALEPGGRTSESIRVWNKSDAPVIVRLYGAGVQVVGGEYRVAPFSSRSDGAGGWIDPDRTTVRLGPGDVVVVPFAIVAPAVMTAPHEIAAIVAESDSGVSSQDFEVVSRLALLVEIDRRGSPPLGMSWWVWVAGALVLAVMGAVLGTRVVRRPEPGDARE